MLRELALPAGHPDRADRLGTALAQVRPQLGTLLEAAITAKVLCLLAHTLAATELDTTLPGPVRRHLAGALRLNQHRTRAARTEIAQLTTAARDAEIVLAALNGIAVESVLYCGQGERQFTDLDVLVAPDQLAALQHLLSARGYHHRPGTPGAWTAPSGDPLIPDLTIDLATHLDPGADATPDLLARRENQPIPGHPVPLPVLAAPDALHHTLHRLGRATGPRGPLPWSLCMDGARQLATATAEPELSTNEHTRAGYILLRSLWPDPPTIGGRSW